MRLLTLSSLTPHTGNLFTAERITRAVCGSSSESSLLDVSTIPSADTLAEMLKAKEVDLVIGIHAFRAGRVRSERESAGLTWLGRRTRHRVRLATGRGMARPPLALHALDFELEAGPSHSMSFPSHCDSDGAALAA